jgi:flagellar L-ring protein precursor FlgH
MRTRFACIACAAAAAMAAALMLASPARADSLFSDSNAGGYISDQIGDRRSALAPGALVTVLVTEDIKAEQSAQTKAVKDSKLTSTWDFGTAFPKIFGNNAVKSGIALTGKEDFAGDGITRRGGTITMTVACQVMEVLADGSLRIKGNKEILVNQEKSTVLLTGVVRPYDISETNTIASQKIANMKLEYEGSGPNTAKSTPGLLTRVLNWLF